MSSKRRLPACLLAVVLAIHAPAVASAQTSGDAPTHPLDPLTAPEIATAARLVKAAAQFPRGAKFAALALKEPLKDDVLAYAPGKPLTRQALAVVLDPAGNRTFEVTVNLSDARVVAWTEIKGAQPAVLASEYEVFNRIVKSDPDWQAAMRKRGIENFDLVQVDYWAAGEVAARFRGRRLFRGVSYYKAGATNMYGRPIEGIVALVDMNAQRVVELTDTGVRPIPPASQELDEKSTGVREPPKPLLTTQPQGASFVVEGHEVRWQKWRFRFAMQPREGLVLHTIGYDDGGRLRPILYRGSLSEMAVPYGDADRNWRWRSAFDVGEYGMGRLASSIEPDTDAPPNATLLDATFADDDGVPYVQPRAIGLYERDGGLLWKHDDALLSKRNESRRARELVAFFIATIGNYDYAINWIFHQDGTLEVDAALTGIMLPKGVTETRATAAGGHLVAPNVVAPQHQHFFNFRLDFDVDGPRNSVFEMNSYAAPAAPGNPSLNGMVMQETLLSTELIAQRRLNLATARTWAIANPAAMNALGGHSSYILVPGANSVPLLGAASQIRRRAGFIDNHFWATRYNPGELYAAGPYPNQSTGGDGLPRWAANSQSIVNQDLVVWYTMGITHIPRPEEWPVMSVHHAGFKLIPAGFFTRNPALDVPR